MSEDAEKAAISADDWAAAMAEQETAAQPAEDDWAAAMAEQAASDADAQQAPEPQKAQIFQPITGGGARNRPPTTLT